MVNYFFFPILLLYCCLNIGFAQSAPANYIANVQYFSTEQGLAHWNVNTVIQDSEGFIWVGTENGLSRFDGHRFQMFTVEKDSLAFRKVHHILEDAEGWLWLMKCRNYKYLVEIQEICFIHARTFEVQSVEERFGADSPLLSQSLYSAIGSSNRAIFIGTHNGNILHFSPDAEWEYLETGLPGKLVLHYSSEEKMLLGNSHERFAVGQVVQIDALGKVRWSYPSSSLKLLPKDKQGVQWLWERITDGTVSPIHLYHLTDDQQLLTHSIEKTPFNERMIAHWGGTISYRDTDDTYWYISENHFWVFHPSRGLLYDFSESNASIINNAPRRVFFDKQNNVWVSTGNGLYKIQLKYSSFKKHLSLSLSDYTIKNAISTRGLLVQDGQLWVNTINPARYLIDLEKGDTRLLAPLTSYGLKGQIKSMSAKAIAHYDDSSLLLGSNALYIYDIEKEEYRMIARKNKEGMPIIWAIHKDQHQHYWLGQAKLGVERWDGVKDSLDNYDGGEAFPEFKKSMIYTFLEWDAQYLLLGSTTGIYVLDQEKGIVQRYLPQHTVFHLHRDKEQTNLLWIATEGGGLVRQTLGNNLLDGVVEQRQFTILDGLSSNVIYAIYEDDEQNLWMSSDYGIIRFGKKDFNSRAYTEKDGLSHHEFNRISHCQDEAGNLYFGGLNGITSFHPKEVRDADQHEPAPLRITKFQQFDGQKNRMVNRLGELLEQQQIKLRPKDKLFNLEFALLEYQDADRIRYSYRIEGQDKDWIALDDNRLRISGLPYGYYTLKIRGQGATGQFSSQQLSIPIQVQAPFYWQWWFLALMVLLLALLIGLGHQWRIRFLKTRQKALELEVAKATQTIQQQNQSLKQLDRMKSVFFANVSHELKTPLTLLLAPVESVLNNSQLSPLDLSNLRLAKENGIRLNKLINEILDLTKLEAGKMTLNPTRVLWYPFLRRVVANFESYANQKNIQYHFRYIGNGELQVKLDQDKMEIILTNLLSNAFKYTPKNGEINVVAENEGAYLTIQVADTGKGIHLDDLPHIFNRFYQTERKNAVVEGGTGIGLALTRELVGLMEGSINVESELGKGSRFWVKVPRIEIFGQLNDSEIKLVKQMPYTTSPAEIEEYKPSLTSPTDSASILLVEDNFDLRNFLKTLLAPHYHIHAVENGQAALDFLSDHLPHLIISDIMMPILDGYQLLSALKSKPRTFSIPVIMLTARSGIDDELKALRIGVDDYMLKPFEERELLARIENLLMHSQWRKEFRNQLTSELTDSTVGTERQSLAEETLNKEDALWLEDLEKTIRDKIGQFNLSVEEIAYAMATSRWQLNRRIKQLTGLTAKHYLEEIRLNHARNLLECRKCTTVKALTYEIGYKDVRHFSRQFKKRFGKIPSDYL